MADLISIGDKITLEKLSTGTDLLKRKERPKTYASKLLEIIKKDKLKISMPIEGGRIVPLNIGEKYIACFYTDKGLFQCKTVVSDRYREGNLFILVINMLSSLEKNQRRQYYRLETIMKVKMRTLTEDERLILDNENYTQAEKEELLGKSLSDWYDTVIIDISGGGIRFTTSQKIEKDSIINFRFDFNISEGSFEYKLFAFVINVAKMQNKAGFFEYRAEFYDIKAEQREYLIKFVFEEERKRRQKVKGLTK